MFTKKTLKSYRQQVNGYPNQDFCADHSNEAKTKVETTNSSLHDEQGTKTVIFMRHGRIGFPYQKVTGYFIVHALLNLVRKLANKYNLKKNVFYRVLSKLIEQVRKKLRSLIDSDSDYGNLKYRNFMRLLLHEIDPPLAKRNNGIKKIPKEIDVIYHSSATRSIQTARYIQRHFKNRDKQPRIESCLTRELDEVKFSKNILSKEEFHERGGLKGFRAIVLKKWYCGINTVETFQSSTSRIEKLCAFLKNSSDKNILLITHGWYLRLLYIYFKNKEKSFKNLKSPECIFGHGESFQIRLRHDFSPHVSFTDNNKDNEQNVVKDTINAMIVKGARPTIH